MKIKIKLFYCFKNKDGILKILPGSNKNIGITMVTEIFSTANQQKNLHLLV